MIDITRKYRTKGFKMKITQEELNEIVRLHGLWLEDDSNGKQADLRYANLRYANLEYADLGEANLENANLENANLRGVDLSGVKLTDANTKHVDLTEQKTDKVLFTTNDCGTYEVYSQGNLVKVTQWQGDSSWTKPGEVVLTYDTDTTEIIGSCEDLDVYRILASYLQNVLSEDLCDYMIYKSIGS